MAAVESSPTPTPTPAAPRASSVRSMLSVNAFGLGSVFIGFINGVAIAALFGLTRRVDAYYAATLLPSLFLVLCVDYVGKNFLPVFARAHAQSAVTASEVASCVVTIVGLVAAAAALLLALAVQPLFTVLLPGFDAADIELVGRYFWIMAPAIVLSAITPFHEYICQHDDRYTRIAAGWSLQSITNFAAILGLGPFIGEYALPIGYVAGQALTFAAVTSGARYRYRPRITVRREWERQIFTSSAVVMGSGLLVRTRGLIANYLASLLGDGAIAALNFGYKLMEPLERTAFSGVRMLMFSRTARLVLQDHSRELARLYRIALTASFLLLTPVLWWLVLESDLVVRVLFERGAFDPSMTALVAVTLIGYAPSVMFAGVNTVLSNAFYALNRIAVPAVVMPIGTVVYLALAPAIYQPLGVLGLTLALSAVHGTVFVLLLLLLVRYVAALSAASIMLRIAGYAALGGIATALPELALARVELHALVEAALRLAAAVVVYFSTLALVRERTFVEIVAYFRRAHPLLAPRAAN